jgi:alkylation response protein AidB-like acyl-CoA dehydrogenase
VSLDLELDDAQQALAGAVEAFCREVGAEALARRADGVLARDAWRGLGALGVLACATPEGDGGACEIVAALEPLGRACFPGPLVSTFFATQLLPAPVRLRVASGEALVAVGAPPLVPWAAAADVFVETDGVHAWLGRPRGAVAPVATLGAEPWGRVELERAAELGSCSRALALADLALGAYLAGAGQRLVDAASEHARTRRQFGRPIGDFQAVAHPLADCAMRLGAARDLARRAAAAFDAAGARTGELAAAAHLSARGAALEAASTSHQVFGALGVTAEGPAFFASRRIRQLASLPPGVARAREAVLAPLGL